MKFRKLLFIIFLLFSVNAYAFSGGSNGGPSSGGGTTITSGAGDFGVSTSQSGAVLTGSVIGSGGNLLTSSAFGATLNLSTLLSQDCTVSASGVVTCTQAGGGTGTFKAGSLGVGATPPATSGSATFGNGTALSAVTINSSGAAVFTLQGTAAQIVYPTSGARLEASGTLVVGDPNGSGKSVVLGLGIIYEVSSTLPTLPSCGTGTVTTGSSPNGGEVTATGATTCSLLFPTGSSQVFPNHAFCTVTDETNAVALQITALAKTGFTVGNLTNGDKFTYTCWGN